LVAATKNSFVVPNFVAITKPFFPCGNIAKSSKFQPKALLIEVLQEIIIGFKLYRFFFQN